MSTMGCRLDGGIEAIVVGVVASGAGSTSGTAFRVDTVVVSGRSKVAGSPTVVEEGAVAMLAPLYVVIAEAVSESDEGTDRALILSIIKIGT